MSSKYSLLMNQTSDERMTSLVNFREMNAPSQRRIIRSAATYRKLAVSLEDINLKMEDKKLKKEDLQR